jgi:hypothetical protein
MDIAGPILSSSSSSSVNPLQAAIGHTNSSLQKDISTSLNEKKKAETVIKRE